MQLCGFQKNQCIEDIEMTDRPLDCGLCFAKHTHGLIVFKVYVSEDTKVF